MRAFLVKFFSIHESFFPSRAPHLSHIHYIFIRRIVNFSFIIVNSVLVFFKKKKKKKKKKVGTTNRSFCAKHQTTQNLQLFRSKPFSCVCD